MEVTYFRFYVRLDSVLQFDFIKHLMTMVKFFK